MQNTSSNRYQLQEYIERVIGCSSPENLGSYKQKFEAFKVLPENKAALQNSLREDMCSLYHKGCLTYADAICAIARGYQSWAIVKLYYCVFYLLRCVFAVHDIGFIKCNGIYTLRLDNGCLPEKRDGKKYSGREARGDHKTTIYTFEKDFSGGHNLLSNTVNGKSVFEWMMNFREEINYRNARFSEPDLHYFKESLGEGGAVFEWIERYLSDEVGEYLFQENHCCLAVPSHLIKNIRQEMQRRLGINNPLDEEQSSNIKKLIDSCGLTAGHSMLSLFDS